MAFCGVADSSAFQMARFKRLLLTGAAGHLGRILRKNLGPLTDILRLTDREDLGSAAEQEEIVQADLADFAAMQRAIEDCDAVIHFGGTSVERPWAEILSSSIEGSYNIYEAARRNGVKRIVLASSIHAVGALRRDAGVDPRAGHRPDSLYGLSKCFAEDLARLYWHKFGIESACLRLGFCYRHPTKVDELATWLSYTDMVRLVSCALQTERIGFTIAYGVSANTAGVVSNRGVEHLRFLPAHDAEAFRQMVEASAPQQVSPAGSALLGGDFFALDHPEDASFMR